ncbi:MAG: transposase [Cyanobacteria bacterium J06627_3]
MAPRKLSDADKRDVIEIYRQPGETTSTIATRYGVSTSTISRILKTQLPEDEYRELIAQKRSGPSEKLVIPSPKQADEKPKPEKPIPRARKRSRPSGESEDAATPQADEDGQLTLLSADEEPIVSAKSPPRRRRDDVSAVATELLTDSSVRREEDDDLDDLDEDLDDIDDDLDSELDDEFDDDDDDEFDSSGDASLLGAAVEIMPIADAVFPRTCYLVVDRLSELITHPLKEFAELGNIPAQQESARTLPIFDNHRVARRFSRRNQRVIKVPDGQLITKATSYLQAKGITHLLIDGNIYALLG